MKNSIFKTIIFVTAIFLPFFVSAEISKIVFMTEEQRINQNELSGPITIQIQDSSGNSFQTRETLDLEFISTSPTGEFLGGTGNPVTKTMSRNTANRTFHYRDSSEGNFTITIKATGRESGKSWEAKQSISVGDSAPSVLSASTESESAPQSNPSFVSTSVASTQNAILDIEAGPNRVATIGTPTTFQATIKRNTTRGGGLDFVWSFGDGNIGVGQNVSHIYKYPGEYVVVLRATAGDVRSVSRAKVRAIEPSIDLIEHKNYIELHNKTKQEINLFNWKITSEGRGFIFQADTIVLPNSKITIDRGMLRMRGEKEGVAKLFDSDGGLITSATKELNQEELKNIQGEINNAWQEVDAIVSRALSANLIREKNSPNTIGDNISPVAVENYDSQNNNEAILGESIISDNQGVEILYEEQKREGAVSNFFNFVLNLFR